MSSLPQTAFCLAEEIADRLHHLGNLERLLSEQIDAAAPMLPDRGSSLLTLIEAAGMMHRSLDDLATRLREASGSVSEHQDELARQTCH